jgi:glycoside/pentoside/hexuronide:cation symporter, GPH family
MSEVRSSALYSGSVPMGQKIAFGVGMLANQLFPAALGIFMVVLVSGLGFPPWLWGIVFFVPRLFDAITDPIMGFISDNTRSKWGRRRQYVFLGAVITGVSFIFMWQLHIEDGIVYNFIYFMIFSFMFYLGLTIFSIPYVAMGYEMTNDYHERTRVMAVAQWIGQWAWVIAPWFWVVIYSPDWFESPAAGSRQLAVWVGLFCLLLALVPAIFVKSRPTTDEKDYEELNLNNVKKSLKSILRSFKEAFSNSAFRKLCISTFLVFNSFNTIAAFSFFIIVHYTFGGDQGAAHPWPTLHGMVGALCTTFITIPIVSKVSQRIGKKKTFVISQSISILGYILFWWCLKPGISPYWILLPLPLFSFGIGGLFTLMMSMTADVCDLDELNSGLRREGIFGAIYWWMVKFGLAFAGLSSGLIMSIVGFDQNAPLQTTTALMGLRLFYSGLPILGTFIAIAIMWNYDLSEKKSNEIRVELDKRHSLKVKASEA